MQCCNVDSEENKIMLILLKCKFCVEKLFEEAYLLLLYSADVQVELVFG